MQLYFVFLLAVDQACPQTINAGLLVLQNCKNKNKNLKAL